jgi:L-threonylcarbamoyladenylate synthase
LDVRDTQSGFRAYPVDTLLDPAVSAEHYAFETEVLVKAAWKGVEIVNVDISVFYPEKGERVSHFKIFKDNFRISLLHAKLTGERLLRGNRANRRKADGHTVGLPAVIDASSPSAPAETAERLSKPGSVVLIPTETVYGLACRWDDARALERIREMKGRGDSKPFQMLADSVEMAVKSGARLDEGRETLVKSLTPGPITFVVDAADDGKTSIGFRIPDHGFALALIKELGAPLAATSANPSGRQPAATVEDALSPALSPAPDAAVDAGRIEGDASTVADIRGDSVEILRGGPVSKREIEEQWKKATRKTDN